MRHSSDEENKEKEDSDDESENDKEMTKSDKSIDAESEESEKESEREKKAYSFDEEHDEEEEKDDTDKDMCLCMKMMDQKSRDGRTGGGATCFSFFQFDEIWALGSKLLRASGCWRVFGSLMALRIQVYLGGIVAQLQFHFPDASFMVFNFREGEQRSQISDVRVVSIRHDGNGLSTAV